MARRQTASCPWPPRPGTGEWWKYGGGGTVWDSIVYDPELKLVYLGTGNGSPHMAALPQPRRRRQPVPVFHRGGRMSTTGEYVWHYQMVPDEQWDFTCTQPMILADLNIDGAAAQGDHAGAQERLLLRAGSRQRQADLGEDLRAEPVGHRDRHEDRSPHRQPGGLCHRDAQADDAHLDGGAQLATRCPTAR